MGNKLQKNLCAKYLQIQIYNMVCLPCNETRRTNHVVNRHRNATIHTNQMVEPPRYKTIRTNHLVCLPPNATSLSNYMVEPNRNATRYHNHVVCIARCVTRWLNHLLYSYTQLFTPLIRLLLSTAKIITLFMQVLYTAVSLCIGIEQVYL